MCVRKDYFKYVFIEIILCIGLFLGNLQSNGSLQSNMETYIGVLSVINLTLFFLTLKKIRNELFSISSMFVIFMYLFNLGIPISRVFGWVDYSTERFMDRRIYPMGGDTFLSFLIYCFLLITMMQVGILYYYSKHSTHLAKTKNVGDSKEREDYDYLLNTCHNIGTCCTIVGIIPYIYGEYQYLLASLVYGYQNSENTLNLSGTGIGLIGNLFIIGTTMWLFSFQKQKKKFNSLFACLVLYQIIRMWISGDRSTGVVLILMWILIRHKFISPIRGSRALIYSVLIYAGMVLLKVIEMTRNISSPSAGEIVTEVLQSNMLVETILEYGGNVWSGLMVYYAVPAEGTFRYGLIYIAAIIGKPLSILGINDSIWYFADFSRFLTDSSRGTIINTVRGAMGGSFSGEWWFNFGWFGILLIPVFGYFLAKFSDACVDRMKNPVLSAYLLYVATLVIWWVRQYVTSVAWYTIFYGVSIYIMYQFFWRRAKHRDYSGE